ncbi:N-formylglutamate amidohydrolase [Carboxylicivirga marina]|uniref:N-formylglutamate amidohydrolase n=1 Tax=Carboxylicivirga marina TaxID=2800988 RepID=A0ABS1HJH5_9BACT|nr:N-formylglutamate amidohydrolase [Carboxylicivirga marina]MBK3517829.1 N-formylglutamate amidohydrolase [Carboxylicivirga marina]
MTNKKAVVLSCEHGGNEVPVEYKSLFENAKDVLNSHRGYDVGARELFDLIDSGYIVYKQSATTSRLLVDINRSLYRRTLFSEFTKVLSKAKKAQILDEYYYAFRRPFERVISQLWQKKTKVLHLSVHSFTSELSGEIRQTDFGILYNPEREEEKLFAQVWKSELKNLLPGYRVRFNYPFRGKPDGFVRYFRDIETEKYLGIEFEMNQKYAQNTELKQKIAQAFNQAVGIWVNS